MAWLRVTGMIPPEPGSYWSEGTLTVEPAYREHLDWSDGGRRAAWPITGTLAGAGTRWASTRDAGDVLIPGADVGVSVEPPVVELTVRLRDGVTGEWKTSRLVGIVEATAPGEWNINAPLKNTLRHVETPGVPAGALRTTDVGVVVPSMAQHQSVDGRVGAIEGARGQANGYAALDEYGAVMAPGVRGSSGGGTYYHRRVIPKDSDIRTPQPMPHGLVMIRVIDNGSSALIYFDETGHAAILSSNSPGSFGAYINGAQLLGGDRPDTVTLHQDAPGQPLKVVNRYAGPIHLAVAFLAAQGVF